MFDGGELHLDSRVQLFNADSRDVLKLLPDNSIDSVVTDPPYALVSIVKRFGGENAAPTKDGDVYSRASAGFMGKQWDNGETAFAVTFWAEVMRVLKPGGHVVAASGTRTYHRLAVAIEDAGFEIRDMVQWLYGSGFPKSHDVSKGIDRALGAEPIVTGVKGRSKVGRGDIATTGMVGGNYMSTRAATPEAAQWQGWGTALKPACEPWVLARKPLDGTVAENVLRWGVGGLNIDGCRVGTDDTRSPASRTALGLLNDDGWQARPVVAGSACGRFPANVIHDGSPEVLAGFPITGPSSGRPRNNGEFKSAAKGRELPHVTKGHDDSGGSAARFFYSAKADAMDRIGSKHPTVKPVDLMQYLCRLVTPPGGIVLDPFAGSGSTGEAAWREGFRCVLIEREEEYADDIRQRLKLANQGIASRKRAIAKKKDNGAKLGGLFDLAEVGEST